MHNPAIRRDVGVRAFRSDPRLIIAIVAMVGLAIAFWTGSRYPALNEKALMGGDTPMSGLAFDIVLDILPDSPFWWALVANTANWIFTNIKGMTFGVLFGAALLTLLSLIKRRSFSSGFANSALGAAIGAPLGVCVNCAVPIAVGLHMGRMRLETTLSAMMASPTLNVIVVSMSFALLPFTMAMTKLVLAFVLVLLIVPLLCRFVLKEETDRTREEFGTMAHVAEPTGITGWLARRLAPKEAGPAPDGIGQAIWWYAKAFGSNLFTIAIITVPMMLAAAVLGAVISAMFDSAALAGVLPRSGMILVPLAMLAVALVFAFVPAPIALDVILTIVLLSIGLDVRFATVALIALGSTSIYAVIILWKVVSPRTSIVIFGSVVALAVLGGVIAHYMQPIEDRWERNALMAAVTDLEAIDLPAPPPPPPGMTATEISRMSAPYSLLRDSIDAIIESNRGSAVALERLQVPSRPGDSNFASGETRFTRIAGQHLGLAEHGVVTPLHEIDTYMFGGSITSGDIDGDGWDDIAWRRPTGARGLSVYRNVGGSFVRQAIDLGQFEQEEFLAVAFADWNGDGLPELVASTRSDKVLILPNDEGSFDASRSIVIPLPYRMRAPSLVFADFDADGALDMAIGLWASGHGREGLGQQIARDAGVIMAWNEGTSAPTLEPLPVTPGQTLALLAHDFDGNGYPDILKGDDLAGTDEVLFFGPDRTLLPFALDDQPFAYVTRTSMGFARGDWNNDLLPDFYHVQIADENRMDRDAMRSGGTHLEICRQAGGDLGWAETQVRQCASRLASTDRIRRSSVGSSFKCTDAMNGNDRQVCVAMAYLSRLSRDDREGLTGRETTIGSCQSNLTPIPVLRELCDGIQLEGVERWKGERLAARHRPTQTRGNLLFNGQADGSFAHVEEAAGARMPGWSWNSRFTDLDQDGLQDLLVMTGIWLSPGMSTTNTFYRNTGEALSEATVPFGFTDVGPAYSFALTDFDRDGDVDVIRPPDGLVPIVHRNDAPSGRALWVRLKDARGNRYGIGATVTICTNGVTQVGAGSCQRRWIELGGGYMSFDAPRAHFGLGNARNVSLIEIRWPDGEISRLRPEQLSPGEVVVSRS